MISPLKRKIPFNRPHMTGRELEYIVRAHAEGHLSGNGAYTKNCQRLLKERLGVEGVLLVHSCTAALEMAALLLEVGPGDEVVMPSFTFVSTANAFVLRGARPVFVDIRPDTLNIDEKLIEEALTPRTKAICVVHYAGVGCEMDAIMALAGRRGLPVLEDAAQGLEAAYKGRPLGAIGQLGALSFHETKNVISGEGGALAIQDPALFRRAEILWEKGTDRALFNRGEVDKYTWRDLGSSYLPSELTAAFLLAQLEAAEELTINRRASWNYYHRHLEEAERQGFLRRPVVPAECQPNGHIYHILLPTAKKRDEFLKHCKDKSIGAVFHYVPLHSSPAGLKFGRFVGDMKNTDDLSARLVRLPLWNDMDEDILNRVLEAAFDFFKHSGER